MVGFSMPSSATYGIVRRTRFESLYFGKPTIAVGGVHPSFYPKETIIDFRADVVAIGSGEKTILEIVEAHNNAKDFSRVKGVCFMREGSVIFTLERIFEKSIDWLPLPARHLLNESDFIMSNRLAGTNIRMTHIMLSRGCPFSCHFCAVMQKKVQCRSGNNVRMELEHLKSAYKIGGFAIVDDNFIVNKSMVKKICRSIKNLGLSWSALSRVDTVDYELLQIMHDAGCIELKFGIESGSEKLLRTMGKNISGNQIRKAIILASSIGIGVKVFLIHGFPGENLASTRETISLLKDVAPMIRRVSLFRFVPLPGSYVFRKPDRFNLKISACDLGWERFHIYHNSHHWWGNANDFQEVNLSYRQLKKFITDNWPKG